LVSRAVREPNADKQTENFHLNSTKLAIAEGMFGRVVMVVFQSVFHSEMHQNNVFYFLKIIFEINTSKRSEIIKKILI
jgi:hypothetical protein